MIEKDAVDIALAQVEDPEVKRSLVDLGMIRSVEIADDQVRVTVALTSGGCPLKHKIDSDIKTALASVPGVVGVEVDLQEMSTAEKEKFSAVIAGPKAELSVASTTHVIGVASGKGGVGKSTVTVNLAAALVKAGHKVGLLDADIWGFSIPRMMGLRLRPTAVDDMIIPLDKRGLKVMSIGFFADEEQPIIWRGPLVHRAITQFLTQVLWGDLDYLLIDLPPGTGDVTITLAKTVPSLKMLMVTTPQPAASKVAARAGHMAHKSGIEVIGVVENMSYYVCADCASRNYLFGRGGGQAVSEALGAPLLGELPFEPAAREGADAGEPVVWADPQSPLTKAVEAVAERLVSAIKSQPGSGIVDEAAEL